MTLHERIDQQSFCYDPDFPPEIAEGLPLTAARTRREDGAALRRAFRSCGQLAAALTHRRSGSN
jgi:hypothetical protein